MTKNERFKVNARLMQKFNAANAYICDITEYGTWSTFIAFSKPEISVRVEMDDKSDLAIVKCCGAEKAYNGLTEETIDLYINILAQVTAVNAEN